MSASDDAKLIDAPHPHPQSMRAFIEQLRTGDELLVLDEPVSTDYEISAWLDQTAQREAVLFNRIDGQALRGVGNLLNSLERIAAGLGLEKSEVQQRLNHSIAHAFHGSLHAGIGVEMVASAPCQEVRIDARIIAQSHVERLN